MNQVNLSLTINEIIKELKDAKCDVQNKKEEYDKVMG